MTKLEMMTTEELVKRGIWTNSMRISRVFVNYEEQQLYDRRGGKYTPVTNGYDYEMPTLKLVRTNAKTKRLIKLEVMFYDKKERTLYLKENNEI